MRWNVQRTRGAPKTETDRQRTPEPQVSEYTQTYENFTPISFEHTGKPIPLRKNTPLPTRLFDWLETLNDRQLIRALKPKDYSSKQTGKSSLNAAKILKKSLKQQRRWMANTSPIGFVYWK